MNIKICPLCAGVSILWLSLSVGMVLGFLPTSNFQLPTSMLMGGTVVGIAFQRNSLRWKTTVIIIGMPLAYLLLVNLNTTIVIIEFVILVVFAFVLFYRKIPADNDRVRSLQEKMKSCC